MSAPNKRYVILTQAPYGGVKGPVPTFASHASAKACGEATFWGVNWAVLPTLVYPTGVTYGLFCSLDYGGVRTIVHTSQSPIEVLRYGMMVCAAYVPRAILMSSVEPPPLPDIDNEPPPDIMFSPDPPPLRPQSPLSTSAQQWAAEEMALAGALEALKRPRLPLQEISFSQPAEPEQDNKTVFACPIPIRPGTPGLKSRASCNDLLALAEDHP